MTYTREQIEVAAQNASECGPVQQAIIRQLLAENDALRDEKEKAEFLLTISCNKEGMIKLHEDAERYRWLLRNYLRFNLCDEAWKHGSIDTAIDAARKKD